TVQRLPVFLKSVSPSSAPSMTFSVAALTKRGTPRGSSISIRSCLARVPARRPPRRDWSSDLFTEYVALGSGRIVGDDSAFGKGRRDTRGRTHEAGREPPNRVRVS